nr:immunoglobulin light chain junction region [Macaca mulatta]MOW16051.1 immunoglobulin light chain junction region [Macaca mulatta]MOW18405.1 immunoglobulin light chain junction region [Macaca mulatta]
DYYCATWDNNLSSLLF